MSEVPTLKDLALQQCLRVLPYIHDIGDARYDIVKPILARMSARQLLELETASPQLVAHTNELWRELILKDFADRPCPQSHFRKGYQQFQKEKESHLGAVRERLKHNQRQYAAQREASAIVPIIEPPRKRDPITNSAVVGQYNSPIMQQLARKTHSRSRFMARPRPVSRQPVVPPTRLPRAAPFAPPSKKPRLDSERRSIDAHQANHQVPPGPPLSSTPPLDTPRRRKSPSIFIKRR